MSHFKLVAGLAAIIGLQAGSGMSAEAHVMQTSATIAGALTPLQLLDAARAAEARGMTAEAERLYRQSVDAFSAQIGPDAQETLNARSGLALALARLDRFDEAHGIFRDILPRFERLLGRDHLDTLHALNDQAVAYQRQGRNEDALPLFQRAEEGMTARLGPTHASTLAVMRNIVRTYAALNQPIGHEIYLRTLLEREEGSLGPDHLTTLRTASELGSLYYVTGDYARAEPLLIRASAGLERRTGLADRITRITLGDVALLYGAQGRSAEAEALWQRLLAAVPPGPAEAAERLSLTQNLATLYFRTDRVAEAEAMFRQSAATASASLGPESRVALSARGNLAVTLSRLGRHAEALQIRREVTESYGRLLGPEHPETLQSRSNLATTLFETGNVAEAEELMSRTYLDMAVLGSNHPDRIHAASNLVVLRLNSPTFRRTATPPARFVARWLARQRQQTIGSPLQESERDRLLMNESGRLTLLADALWVEDEPASVLTDEVFGALQGALASPASQVLVRRAVRRIGSGRGSGVGELVAERERLAQQWRDGQSRLAGALAADAEGDARTTAAAAIMSAEQQIARIDGALRERFPDYFALINPEPVAIEEIRQGLGADEALLLVVPSRFGTHVVSINSEGASWHRADWASSQIAAAVRRLRWDVGARVNATPEEARRWDAEHVEGTPFGFDRSTAHALYNQIVAPALPRLAGRRRLYIAASGALSSLPFSLLVSAPPAGADNDPSALRATRWMADDFAMVHLPTLQSLAMLRRAAASEGPPSERFAGFGDPVLMGPPVERGTAETVAAPPPAPATRSGGTASVGLLRRLARLPGTARELEAMRGLFGTAASEVYLRDRLTEPAVRQADLSQASVITFATHGLMAGEGNVPEPGLVMTPPRIASEEDDGFLAASEVAQLTLNAEWVILSACNTATGPQGDGEGLSDLARAFFFAGARNLLASHWPVGDEVSARMTVRTLELRRQGLGRAEAFQQAMREVRQDASHDTARGSWAHPIYWAPFVLIGDGGR